MTANELRTLCATALRVSRIENYDYAKARARLALREWFWSNLHEIIAAFEDAEKLRAKSDGF